MLCKRKGVKIVEAEVCPDHIHMLEEIPPSISVSSFVGYLKGKSTLMIYRRKTGAAFNNGENIYICDDIDTPFILGTLSPKIYIPSLLTEEERSYVIAHEKAHLKRLDCVWKPLGFILLAVYWFNPLSWVAYILLCRDIELACDDQCRRRD